MRRSYLYVVRGASEPSYLWGTPDNWEGLVLTDVPVRGDLIEDVIRFYNDYEHRYTRSHCPYVGRAGRVGYAYSCACSKEPMAVVQSVGEEIEVVLVPQRLGGGWREISERDADIERLTPRIEAAASARGFTLDRVIDAGHHAHGWALGGRGNDAAIVLLNHSTSPYYIEWINDEDGDTHESFCLLSEHNAHTRELNDLL